MSDQSVRYWMTARPLLTLPVAAALMLLGGCGDDHSSGGALDGGEAQIATRGGQDEGLGRGETRDLIPGDGDGVGVGGLESELAAVELDGSAGEMVAVLESDGIGMEEGRNRERERK